MSDALSDLFLEGDYRFHLTLRRGAPADFFRSRDASGVILAERARWASESPDRYTALEPEGRPLLDEFSHLARDWGCHQIEDTHALARGFEPDVLLLAPDARGAFRLRGGALCFPTRWALEDKIGRTMDEIHEPVPGLNRALGGPIEQVLSKLKPGIAFLRDNWGLAATDELNLHPARHLPPPSPPVALERLWLRVEHQALVALPASGGVAFGIRIALHRMDAVAQDPASPALARALASMPPEVARYKRIDAVREHVVRLLESSWR